ncbi:MAG: hypothetical protein K2W96_18365 [Gemmataceae bacterium]|nr:hypothetical protein [Gemmataceae bacterium]
MWAALALTTLTTLAPAQGGKLSIKNDRLTHGVLGATRTDEKILPGDIAVLSFDIHGLTPGKDGKVLYSAGFKLAEKAGGKALMTQDPEPKEAVNSLGGDVVPAVTFVTFGLDTKPGTYVVTVTIQDDKGKAKTTLTREIEVLPAKFGFVRARFMAPTDERSPLPTPPVAVPGQAIHLRYSLAGFRKDPKVAGKVVSNVSVEIEVQDEKGNPTVAASKAPTISTEFKEGEALMDFYPVPLQLNRPGKYKIVMKATDNVSKATAERTLDLEVLKN